MKESVRAFFLRNAIFGVEDSLVSTVGLLSGIAVAGVPQATVLLTGVVLIVVEGFSMGTGSFLSESSAEEYNAHSNIPLAHSIQGGLVMFFSYVLAGFIPLIPYIVTGLAHPIRISILLTLVSLFILGITAGRASNVNAIVRGIRMLVVGGFAVAIGILAGQLLG